MSLYNRFGILSSSSHLFPIETARPYNKLAMTKRLSRDARVHQKDSHADTHMNIINSEHQNQMHDRVLRLFVIVGWLLVTTLVCAYYSST